MTNQQRDALLLAETEEERQYLRKMIKEHGDDYDPEADWWPNKYPDM